MRFGAVVGQKIISIIGIWIACSAHSVIATPRNRTTGEHQSARTDGTCRHFMEVVGSYKIVGIERFALQIASITVYFDTVGIAESGFAHKFRGELIDSRRGHAYLDPTPGAQHAVTGVAVLRCNSICMEGFTHSCNGVKTAYSFCNIARFEVGNIACFVI